MCCFGRIESVNVLTFGRFVWSVITRIICVFILWTCFVGTNGCNAGW